MTLTITVVDNNEKSKMITFTKKPKTFNQLKTRIKLVFGDRHSSPDFNLAYNDNSGDLITMITNSDWKACKQELALTQHIYPGCDQTLTFFKLEVVSEKQQEIQIQKEKTQIQKEIIDKKEEESNLMDKIQGLVAKAVAAELLKANTSKVEEKGEKVVHVGYGCGACQMKPIIGIRYGFVS